MIPAFLLHISASSFAALFLSLAFGRLTPFISGISLLSGTAISVIAYKLFNAWGDKSDFQVKTTWEKCLYIFLLYVAFRHFEYMFYFSGKNWWTLGINNFGDLPLHLTYIRYFSGGCSFWPANPYFSTELLRYPFGIDLYSALFESIGIPANTHLFILGILSFVVTLITIHRWLGWWGAGALFLNGGCAGWIFLKTGVLHDYQANLAWKNFFLSIFITQRGFLFAFPAGIYLLNLFFNICFKGKTLHQKLVVPVGFLWGILSFFSLHSFLAVSLMVGSWALITRTYKKFIPLLIIAVPIALFFILISTDMLQKSSVLHFKWGWMADNQNILKFWWRNTGLWMLLPLLIGYEVWKGTLIQYRWFFITILFWFFLFTFVMFAPWAWDNIKMMIWPYLCFCLLLKEASENRIPKKFEAIPGMILLFTGIVSLAWSVGSTQTGHPLYRAADLINAKHIMDIISKDAVFATTPTSRHPVSYWGKAIAVGYAGHMWSHGISAEENELHLKKIMTGDKNWKESAKTLGITHIYWGPEEIRLYGNHNQPWKSILSNISKIREIEVYELKNTID